MSEFYVEVVRIGKVEKHPNADSLSITQVHGGYPCIIKTGDFVEGDLAAYIPVDALVPTDRPMFAFLAKEAKADGTYRIRARKLRGVFSMGLLVKAPDGSKEGDNVRDVLGVGKYLPPAEREAGQANRVGKERLARRSETAVFDRRAVGVAIVAAILCVAIAWPFGVAAAPLCALAAWWAIRRNRAARKKPQFPVYDLEGIRRHMHALKDGEHVLVTEKIHGCNAAYVHTGRRFWVRSRTVFRENDGTDPGFGLSGDVWHLIAARHGLEEKLRAFPNVVLFGEVYGEVQDLRYGVPAGERVRFVAFDALDLATGRYLDHDALKALCDSLGVPMAPVLHDGPWHPTLLEMAEGPSTLPGASHVREGIVVRPRQDRIDPHVGRVVLKLAGQGYLLRKEAA